MANVTLPGKQSFDLCLIDVKAHCAKGGFHKRLNEWEPNVTEPDDADGGAILAIDRFKSENDFDIQEIEVRGSGSTFRINTSARKQQCRETTAQKANGQQDCDVHWPSGPGIFSEMDQGRCVIRLRNLTRSC